METKNTQIISDADIVVTRELLPLRPAVPPKNEDDDAPSTDGNDGND